MLCAEPLCSRLRAQLSSAQVSKRLTHGQAMRRCAAAVSTLNIRVGFSSICP